MAEQSTSQSSPMIRCEECGRENYAFADKCWLCQGNLSEEKEIVDAELALPKEPSTLRVLGIVLGSIAVAIAFSFAVVVALFVMCIVVLTNA